MVSLERSALRIIFANFPSMQPAVKVICKGSVFSLNRMDRARGNYSGYVAAMAKPMEIRAWQSGQAPQSPPLVAASAKMKSAAREAYLHVKTANIANILKINRSFHQINSSKDNCK